MPDESADRPAARDRRVGRDGDRSRDVTRGVTRDTAYMVDSRNGSIVRDRRAADRRSRVTEDAARIVFSRNVRAAFIG